MPGGWGGSCRGVNPFNMKLTTVFCLAALVALVAAEGMAYREIDLPSHDDFLAWKVKHGKAYDNDAEHNYRFSVFQDNARRAHEFNRAQTGAVFGVTKFSDLTAEEFRHKFLNPLLAHTNSAVHFNRTDLGLNVRDAPTEVDWRKKGAVTPVKNQAQCGSCWSFSATGAMEGAWFLAKGDLLSLSEEQLVSCDKNCFGCNGCWPLTAIRYVVRTGGIESEADYPYSAGSGTPPQCKVDKTKFVAKFSGARALPKDDETKLAAATAAKGPVSIALNAGRMQLYTGGIDNPSTADCDPSQLDHAVLIVGYGTDSSTPFWTIKNSWGTDWGEDGYYRLVRGKNACGVASTPVIAIV